MNDHIFVFIPALSIAFSIIALYVVLKLNSNQRKEYEFFVAECYVKTGRVAGWRDKLSSYNAALGGPAPKWHWIAPVVSSSVGAEYFQRQ